MIQTQRSKAPFTLGILILSIIGVFTLASTLVNPSGVFIWGDILTKQILFVAVGFIIYFLMSKIDYSYFKYPQIVGILYFATLILLILTLLFGEERNNAQRWLNIVGVQVQASEIAKIIVILATAYIFTYRQKFSEVALILLSFLAVLPIVALVFIQPHGAMAIILLTIWAITTFTLLRDQFRNFILVLVAATAASGIAFYTILSSPIWLILVVVSVIIFIFAFNARDAWRRPLIFMLLAGFVLGTATNYSWNNVLEEYQKNRIVEFRVSEEQDPKAAFNVNQAKIAIGSGRIFGKGWGEGTQSKLNFLPEHQTDFIFASFAEEFGLLGTTVLLFLYTYILYATFRPALTGKVDDFGSILLVSLGMKILLELFINIGTNTGLTPATGIPLPLMSAGGSVTIMTFFSLGVIQSIISRSKEGFSTN